jgi:sarcosine oxidase subunit alpha
VTSSDYGYRLRFGGLIDRSRAIAFSFNGQALQGHPGDTLASALVANGVNLIGRSFKYHRPRGFFGAGSEDPNSMLAVRDAYGYEPALRAGQVRLVEGLESRSVTGWPSPSFDLAAGLQLAAPILSAGFYYKTFKWPTWALFEPLIKRSTGFGKPRELAESRAVQHRHAVCDILVVGGGPAALAAARLLIGTGLQVILADEQPRLGGSLNWETAMIGSTSGHEWANGVATLLGQDSNFQVLTSTTVTAAYEGQHFTMLQFLSDARGVRCERHWKVRANQVILATGMIDRPLMFAGNDRPGIMLSSAVRRLIGEFGVAPARELAIYTNNDSGYLTALAAHKAGIKVATVVDTRPQSAALHLDAVRSAGAECLCESQIVDTSGYRRLSTITVRNKVGRRERIDCRGLAVSGGFTPLVHLATHRGAKPTYDVRRGLFLVPELPRGWHVAGGAAGSLDLETTLAQGRRAAAAVIDALAAVSSLAPQRSAHAIPAGHEAVQAGSFGTVAPLWRPAEGPSSSMWVDLQNDVKVSDVELAAREGYLSVEHLKRYTTLGMGTDQGRTSNVNGLAILAEVTQRSIETVGTTTFRPPYTAVRMGTIANRRQGDLYKPRRYLPAHAVHEKLSAVFDDVGWERPDWYRVNGSDRESAVAAEMAAVRTHVGVFDGSSLGKIEVTGPDAASFLSRFYVSNMSSLKPGRIRYSVMLKEDGVIFDDGVVVRLAENQFLASPSSGQADAVAAWFERWRQTEWPSMKVAISVVTSGWGSLAISGPRARELLARLKPSFDITPAAFPHMEIRQGTISGVPARVARVSFTGELQYEISVPARYASSLLRGMLEVGGAIRPRAVGLEAWLRLRLEKGYLHLGSDTNGRTTPLDIGMAGVVAKRTDDFIGKRSLSLSFATSIEREQLVGVVPIGGVLQVGARVLTAPHSKPPCPTEGYVTSACFSPSARDWIGLALIERGHARKGEEIKLYADGRVTRGRICDPVFYDPNNEKLRA